MMYAPKFNCEHFMGPQSRQRMHAFENRGLWRRRAGSGGRQGARVRLLRGSLGRSRRSRPPGPCASATCPGGSPAWRPGGSCGPSPGGLLPRRSHPACRPDQHRRPHRGQSRAGEPAPADGAHGVLGSSRPPGRLGGLLAVSPHPHCTLPLRTLEPTSDLGRIAVVWT